MEMENCIAELTDTCDGIHALPYEVARVKVCSYLRAYSLTKLEKTLGVVNAEAGVKFKSDFVNSVSLCKRNKILPIWNKDLLPLPFKNLAEIIRPRDTTQFGCFDSGQSPGQPEKVLI